MKWMKMEMTLFIFCPNQDIFIPKYFHPKIDPASAFSSFASCFIHQQAFCGVDISNVVQLSKTSNSLRRAADEMKVDMSSVDSKCQQLGLWTQSESQVGLVITTAIGKGRGGIQGKDFHQLCIWWVCVIHTHCVCVCLFEGIHRNLQFELVMQSRQMASSHT